MGRGAASDTTSNMVEVHNMEEKDELEEADGVVMSHATLPDFKDKLEEVDGWSGHIDTPGIKSHVARCWCPM
jgi:hypothetical protein